MLSVVLAVALFNSVASRIDPDHEFQICVEKCTSPNSTKRVQCKLSCSEEMKKNYEQQFNEDYDKLKKEKGEEKCSSCASKGEDIEETVHMDIDERERDNGQEKKDRGTVVLSSNEEL